jgi:hypothetical protein
LQNLQQVLNIGNSATGTNATISLVQTSTGGVATPIISLVNDSSTAGNTGGVPSMNYMKTGRNSEIGDIIGSQHYQAKNFLGTSTEFAKVEASVRNTGFGNDDGAITFSCLKNGALLPFMNINGAENDNNMFFPLDMNGQPLKTATGNLALSSVNSAGPGNVDITAKSGATINLVGNVNIQPTDQLTFTGASLQSITSGGNSGQHLRINLNGVFYKIRLEDDA